MGKIWNKIIAAGICIAVAVGGGITLAHFLENQGNRFASLPNENQVVLNIDRFQANQELIEKVDNTPVRFVADKEGINVVMEAGLMSDYIEAINSSIAHLNNVFVQVNSSYIWNVGIDGVDGASLDDANIKIVHQDLAEGDTGGFVDPIAGELKTENNYNYVTSAEFVISNYLDSIVDSFNVDHTPLIQNYKRNLIQNYFNRAFLDVLGMQESSNSELEGETYMNIGHSTIYDNKIFVNDMRVICSLYGDTAKYGYEKFENLFHNGDLVRDPIQVQEESREQ